MTRILALLSAVSFAASSGIAVAASATGPVRHIVLVHGAYADGSGWKAIADILEKDGYTVSVVQEPETLLADDVAATKRILDQQSGPTVLVGHSYGGAVITEAGNDSHVASLVYVAAFAPDEGQTLKGLIASDPGAAAKDIVATGGFLSVDQAKFPRDFAADVPRAEAQFMAISQVPQSAGSAVMPITTPAWRTRPTYGIIPTGDRMINPALERSMYERARAKVTEIKGASHAVYISHPRAVAEIIEKAARASR